MPSTLEFSPEPEPSFTTIIGLNVPVVLNVKLAGLIPVVDSADFKPTDQSFGVFKEVSSEIDEQFDKLKAMQESGLADFEDLIYKSNIPGLKSI